MANFKKKFMASFWGKFAFIKTFDVSLSKLRRNGDISSHKKLASSPVSPLLTPSSFTQSITECTIGQITSRNPDL